MGDMTVEELKEKKLWFLWSTKPAKNGKVTKVPFSANGGATGTDDAHKGTWVKFDDADASKIKFQASGIGMKIPKGFFLLDIDHRDISDAFVQLMLSRFSSYAEVSPSGNGIHIIGQCDISKLPVHFDDRRKRLVLDSEYYQKRSDVGLELYIGDITNRYGTFTGNTVNNLPIVDCTQTVLTTLDKEMRKKTKRIINFQNGLLKVTATDVELMPHSAEVLSTIQIPCEWKENDVETPVFDAYMDTLTDGDDGIRELLMEFIGVCISNVKGWRMKKALFLVGQGDTGKSQLKSLVERLLGRGNFIGIDLKEIESRFGTGAIYGTRLAGSSDMSFLSVDELKTFKKMTGGDSLFAEFKGQQAFEFTFNGLLWFCMNRLPKFGGDDGKWVYDRIMVVECPNVIPKEQQDKQLLDKMYSERDGIVRKAVRALQNVIANGYRFTEPDSISEARKKEHRICGIS